MPQTEPNPASSDHFLNLVGARLVPTLASRTTARDLRNAITARAVICVHGGVGLGKTLAVRTNLRDLAPQTTVPLSFRKGAGVTTLCEILYQALDLPGETPTKVTAVDDRLCEALEAQPRVLVCDEAQGLSTKALDHLRTLWGEDGSPRFTLVLVGGENCHQRVRSRAALASRIAIWQQYKPLQPAEILQVMPQYHALWTDVPPDDLLWVDTLICHGNFRNWAKTTYHLQEALHEDGAPDHFTRDLMRSVLDSLDSTVRTTGQAVPGYL
ncbi:AAA family ATPase [Streptomyces sp. CA-132043]|uniref:AAA family ATPase n=1 Tax=Streptomyces sp. CA-132043 TaxID=3240048 RepID=UPI003D8C38F5